MTMISMFDVFYHSYFSSLLHSRYSCLSEQGISFRATHFLIVLSDFIWKCKVSSINVVFVVLLAIQSVNCEIKYNIEMCLCAKGKPKPAEQLQRPVISSSIPKSTVLFSANDYDGKSFTDQVKFTTTKKAEAYAHDNLDRDSHYHEEVGAVSKSKLIQPK